VALEQSVTPSRYAMGAAAALARLDPATLEGQLPAGNILDELWREASPDRAERDQVVGLIETALVKLRSWRAEGFPNLEIFYRGSQA